MQSTNTLTRATPLDHLSDGHRERLPLAFGAFLDAAMTATGRATFYNSREEQAAALETAHRDLHEIDRDVYALAMLLPGVTDHSRQQGTIRLLRTPRMADGLFTAEQETRAVHALVRTLPPQRILKLFGMLRRERVNNARTRRLVLTTILAARGLETWSVKYRRKLATALTHAWGRRTASIVASILAKPDSARTDAERRILRRNVHRYVDEADIARVEECVRFALGNEDDLTLGRLTAYRDAKSDFARGKSLPYEVLEGLRSRYHTDKSSADVLEMTKSNLTEGQRIGLQRKAAEAGIEVAFDPSRHDAVQLYVYAYEMGLDEAVRAELARKAESAAARLPVRFGHAAILVDVSASMMGHDTQHRRPIATALALRDLLAATADSVSIVGSDGRDASVGELVEPAGDTSLAAGLVALLERDPDVVFVLTDGYENAPAGRFGEVVQAVRRMGIRTPIHQLSPVFAAEAKGLRSLSPDVASLPAGKPEAIGLGLLKALFESDVERGVAALLGMVAPSIEG